PFMERLRNTKVKLFLDFLHGVSSFDYQNRPKSFVIDTLDQHGFSKLQYVADALQWVTDHLCQKVFSIKTSVNELYVNQGAWHLQTAQDTFAVEKVILATGATPKSLDLEYTNPKCIHLEAALKPDQLAKVIQEDDTVAVFGSSHSAMIIIKNLLDAGAKKVMNFFTSPLRYAVDMGDWVLYDNTGLKGQTALWARQNISKSLHPKVERYLCHPEIIDAHFPSCSKVVYAIGFKPRVPKIQSINPAGYDKTSGIIAPGLFGTGIAFPRLVTDPNGNQEMNIGLFKFMTDIQKVLPIWMRYGL
ncbi:SidA/IucD/PvdA family monooxygenase, partial [Facilibium subflavum]|uniref:SidA/IucD/PvdA family monooxygenase n=1 Tax=Facilibium subflavum TaxID=2219058 RepID=UPI0013C31073